MKTKNIPITAEAVALFRTNRNEDRFSKYFVTNRIKRLYSLMKILLLGKTLENIINNRLELSKILDREIKKEKPQQILEIASGFSTRGLEMTLSNKNLIYVELDLKEVIEKKREKIKEILAEENLKWSKNYHLVESDVIRNNFSDKIIGLLDKNKNLLVTSEGFNPYLGKKEHDILTRKITALLKKFKGGTYISQDFLNKTNKMFSGVLGKLMYKLFKKFVGREKNPHFQKEKECITYFKSMGFKEGKTIPNKTFLVYKCRT